MDARVLKFVSQFVVLACAVSAPLAIAAQDSATPATPVTPVQESVTPAPPPAPVTYARARDNASKWDIFVGYSYLQPSSSVTPRAFGVDHSASFGSQYNDKLGGIVSGAYFFNRYLGFQLEGAYHDSWDSLDTVTSADGGLIFRYPRGRFTPFAHALAGEARARLTGDAEPFAPNSWGLDVIGGVGLDYELNHHWAIRIVQADYERLSPHFGGPVGTIDVNATRLSAGIVYHGGSFVPPTPVTLACSASPVSVFAGEPVTLTATAGSLNPKQSVVYTWSGVNVSGNGATVTVATDALAAGSYTVNCGVKEGRAGREGAKPWENATASTSFTVKPFEPPTISCSASPSTIKSGEVSTVTSSGLSPQNRPLTYSYTAAAGSISGNGPTATFNAQGAPTGPVGITCNVSDDKGQTATASTSVTIGAPYVAVAPHSEALCSITFDRDRERPARVDNEAKACLDEVALDLQKQPDAKAVVVGNATVVELHVRKGHRHAEVENLAAQRAINTKAYLVNEKGIDAARVSVATGTAGGNKVEDYLVPSGASFATDVAGTTPVDETVVKPQTRKSLAEKHAAKKHHKAHKKM